jgi:hypothetical protein
MIYKIKETCSNLKIGTSTFYKRLDVLKSSIPETEWNRNDYFYTENKKFFITEKGFEWFKNYTGNNKNTKFQQNSINNDITIYQNQIIDLYKQRIEYLETENKRLLDIIAVKEQRELAKDVKTLGSDTRNNFFSKIVDKFKHKQ